MLSYLGLFIFGVIIGYTSPVPHIAHNLRATTYTADLKRWHVNIRNLYEMWEQKDPKALLTSIRLSGEASRYWTPSECIVNGDFKRSQYIKHKLDSSLEIYQSDDAVKSYRKALLNVQAAVTKTMATQCPHLLTTYLIASHLTQKFNNFDVTCSKLSTYESESIYLMYRDDEAISCIQMINNTEFENVGKVLLEESESLYRMAMQNIPGARYNPYMVTAI